MGGSGREREIYSGCRPSRSEEGEEGGHEAVGAETSAGVIAGASIEAASFLMECTPEIAAAFLALAPATSAEASTFASLPAGS